MTVSMLLNAANVVTAAERLRAIDQHTGRIPINFLLSRSSDLDEQVKDHLHQLANHTRSISVGAPLSNACAPGGAPEQQPVADDVPMQDVSPMDGEHGECQDADEALRDIYRHTTEPGERRGIRLCQKRCAGGLTRKAIRKHTGGEKTGGGGGGGGAGKDLSCLISHPVLLPRDTGSSINTVSASSCMLSSSQGSSSGNAPRRRWKVWEDELLMRIVAEHGASRWNGLARNFPGRNGRQVRLRWMNHLQPSLDKRPWRPEEDAVLLDAHTALGNKWALISMRLGGRTDNSVKNRYKSIVRRAAREAKAKDAKARKSKDD